MKMILDAVVTDDAGNPGHVRVYTYNHAPRVECEVCGVRLLNAQGVSHHRARRLAEAHVTLHRCVSLLIGAPS